MDCDEEPRAQEREVFKVFDEDGTGKARDGEIEGKKEV